MLKIYRAKHNARAGRPSYLEVRGRLSTPGYIGIRHRTPAPVMEADTVTLSTVSA